MSNRVLMHGREVKLQDLYVTTYPTRSIEFLDEDWDEFRADEIDFHGADIHGDRREELEIREAGHGW